MSFFRQYIAPFAVIAIFLIALLAVSARIFLPSDMAAPAPVELEEVSLIVPPADCNYPPIYSDFRLNRTHLVVRG